MIGIIVAESKDVAEFARRAEAWSSSESKPPTDRAMAMRWRVARGGLPVRDVVSFIVLARSYRIAATDGLMAKFIEDAPLGDES